ncbi:hypothetical protein quinque_005009 [Culex quinquefasciatus]
MDTFLLIVLTLQLQLMWTITEGHTIRQICQLSDCSLRTPTNCSLASNILITPAFPATPRTVALSQTPHFFDYFYDPNVTACVKLGLEVKIHAEGLFSVVLTISSVASIFANDFVTILFESDNEIGCFRWPAMQRNCNRERFQITLTGNDSFLLQDLSPEVPPGQEMAFRVVPAFEDGGQCHRNPSANWWKQLIWRRHNCTNVGGKGATATGLIQNTGEEFAFKILFGVLLLLLLVNGMLVHSLLRKVNDTRYGFS